MKAMILIYPVLTAALLTGMAFRSASGQSDGHVAGIPMVGEKAPVFHACSSKG